MKILKQNHALIINFLYTIRTVRIVTSEHYYSVFSIRSFSKTEYIRYSIISQKLNKFGIRSISTIRENTDLNLVFFSVTTTAPLHWQPFFEDLYSFKSDLYNSERKYWKQTKSGNGIFLLS